MEEESDEVRARQQRRYEAARARLQEIARQLSKTSVHPVAGDVAEDVPARAVLVYAADLPRIAWSSAITRASLTPS